MPAYSRDSGVWTETIMRQRDSAAWSGDDALGFVRENGAWVQFQAPAGDEDLLQPINLVAVPGDLEATFTWDNPTPLPIVTPTHVQLRIPSTTAVWTEIPYPDAEITFEFLSPGVEYQFQARYIERSSDDGTILLTGNITEVFFTTTALDGPGTPAEDPGGAGPDTTVPWGTPSGGSSCTWEYIVQTATTPASGAITWDDTAVTGSFAGTLSSLEIDFVASGLACGALARFKYRENCSGILSDYLFGEPFIMQCDWDVACGGIAASTTLAQSLYADPNCLFAFPELCGTTIRDTVNTAIELGKLPGFGSIQTFNGPHTVYGKTSNGFLGKPTLGGQFGNLALLVDGDDLTVIANVHLEAVPGGPTGGSGVAPASMPIVRFGRNVAISAVFSTTTTYIARCSWIDATGTFQSVTGATDLSLDEFHRIGLTMDANGTKTLYVDGVPDGTNTDTTAMAFSDAGIGQDVEVYTNKFMRFNDVAAWDRVLTADEMFTLYNPSPILANADFYWPMDDASISWPLADQISAVNLIELTPAATAVVETSPVNGENIYSLDKGRYEATIGSGDAFAGLTCVLEHHIDAAAYTASGLDHYIAQFSVRDNGTEYIVARIIMDYTHPAGWNPSFMFLDSANVWQTISTAASFAAVGAKAKMAPIGFSINAAGTEINYYDWTGVVRTIAMLGTGQLHHVGAAATVDQGLYKFQIGDTSSFRNPAGQLGRIAVQKSPATLNEMADYYWELWGGVPAEFTIRDHISRVLSSSFVPVVVPSGKTSVELDVIGSSGRGSTSATGSGHSGKGHRMTVSKAVTAGDVIWVNCGGNNVVDPWFTNAFGVSSLRVTASLGGTAGSLNTDRAEVSSGSPFGNTEQEVIGAGGGGHYAGGIGGDGGYPSGTAAVAAGAAGGPGTQVAGGAAAGTGTAGSRSAPGVGSNGSGGDGYYGGGAGSFGSASDQGGGGGSSFIGGGVWSLVSNGVYDPGFTPGLSETANGNIKVRFS